MLIDEMLSRRDFATNVCVALQNQIGKTISGIYDMEELENRTNEEFLDFINTQMKEQGYIALIFTGWVFTKEIYEKMVSCWKYLSDNDFSIIYLLEFKTFIVNKPEETVKIFKSLHEEAKKISNINVRDIVESDNGIQINYFTKSKVLLFEEKPKVLEEIIKEDK